MKNIKHMTNMRSVGILFVVLSLACVNAFESFHHFDFQSPAGYLFNFTAANTTNYATCFLWNATEVGLVGNLTMTAWRSISHSNKAFFNLVELYAIPFGAGNPLTDPSFNPVQADGSVACSKYVDSPEGPVEINWEYSEWDYVVPSNSYTTDYDAPDGKGFSFGTGEQHEFYALLLQVNQSHPNVQWFRDMAGIRVIYTDDYVSDSNLLTMATLGFEDAALVPSVLGESRFVSETYVPSNQDYYSTFTCPPLSYTFEGATSWDQYMDAIQQDYVNIYGVVNGGNLYATGVSAWAFLNGKGDRDFNRSALLNEFSENYCGVPFTNYTAPSQGNGTQVQVNTFSYECDFDTVTQVFSTPLNFPRHSTYKLQCVHDLTGVYDPHGDFDSYLCNQVLIMGPSKRGVGLGYILMVDFLTFYNDGVQIDPSKIDWLHL